MTTTMMQRRAWQGVAFLSYGFRPFFFSAALLAAALIALWVPWLLGLIALPSAFSPLDWHIHELLFGYVPAVMAGFLLTAVPNWTGRLPVVGWPLAGLFMLWLLGRVIVVLSAGLPPTVLLAGSVAFPLALASVIAREIIAGRNWRNLKVLVGVGLVIAAQVLFHYEVAHVGRGEFGGRLAIAATILLIMLIGGRIVPSFTRNWIRRENPGPEPAEFNTFDKLAMLLGGFSLIIWVAAPALTGFGWMIGAVLMIAGLVHAIRLARWRPFRTLAEPLVCVLHAAYAFVPLGLLLAGLARLLPHAPALETAAIHAFTIGAIALMTLAVMTRASRGHSGRPLVAPPDTQAIYLFVTLAAISRIFAALLPEHMMPLLTLSGMAWVLAFLGFALSYGPLLLTRPLK